jgi:deoxyinosine 3'endonuclease (endonuclease V)
MPMTQFCVFLRLPLYLYRALDETVPVIGVAKNRFKTPNSLSVEVLRGESKKPLFVTAEGVEAVEVALLVQQMHGEFRIPDMLKRADMLCRDWEGGETVLPKGYKCRKGDCHWQSPFFYFSKTETD